MNFSKFVRTPFLQNPSGRLLLPWLKTLNKVSGWQKLFSFYSIVIEKDGSPPGMKCFIFKNRWCLLGSKSCLENANKKVSFFVGFFFQIAQSAWEETCVLLLINLAMHWKQHFYDRLKIFSNRKVIGELCEGMKHPPCNSNLTNRHIEISNADIGAQIDIFNTYPRNSHNLLNVLTDWMFRVTGQALTAELNWSC